MKIKVIKKIRTSAKQWIAQGEVFEARRVTTKLLDFNAPFQIISGPFAGEEIPFKLALVLPHEPRPTQQQFDELKRMSEDALVKVTASQKILNEISAVIGEHDGSLVDAVLQLVQDKAELLQTIERHTDEQLNSEKLLQRIRELETIANERDEMIKSIKSVSVVIRDKRNPVEVPRNVAKALDWYRWNGFDNDEIVGHLAAGNKGPNVDVLRSYVQEGSNGHNLLCALLNGYTAVSEKDEAAAMLEGVTALVDKWYHAPSADNDERVLVERICDFIREREAAGEAVTI
ncbi:hypothetical protein ACYCS5_27000 [Paenibacillus sp. SEL3]